MSSILKDFALVLKRWAKGLGIQYLGRVTKTTRLVLPVKYFQAAGSNFILQFHESVSCGFILRAEHRPPLLWHISAEKQFIHTWLSNII